MTFDVVIPARNEAATVAGVVQAALRAQNVGDVIVVDDHSSDDTAEIARRAGAVVIPSRGNGDKAQALASGVAHARADVLVFFDADIVGAQPQHFEALAVPVLSGPYEMAIGMISYGPIRNRLFVRLPPISGLRGLRRRVFEAIPDHRRRGFQIEIMMNEVAVRARATTAIRVLSGCRHRTKVQKLGVRRGVASHLRMTAELLDCFRFVPLWTYPSYLSRLVVLPPA